MKNWLLRVVRKIRSWFLEPEYIDDHFSKEYEVSATKEYREHCEKPYRHITKLADPEDFITLAVETSQQVSEDRFRDWSATSLYREHYKNVRGKDLPGWVPSTNPVVLLSTWVLQPDPAKNDDTGTPLH